MINFDHELQDRSTFKNHALHEFTNQQLLFAEGKDVGLSFAVNFNPSSNSTYDKIWIPFSPSTQIIYDTPAGFSIFTRIMPLVTTDLGTVASPTLQTNRIRYYGGPVFNRYKVAIYNIFWGSGWNDSNTETWANYLPTSPYYGNAQNVNGPSIRSAIITGMQNIANSEYWDGLWSYAGQPGITIGGNFTNTTTPYPMALGETLPEATSAGMGAEGVILAERAAGHVPNWDAFGEQSTDKDGVPLGPPNNYNLDYRHLIFVHLDPRHMSQAGSAGFAWKSFTPGPPPGTVYYAYCVLGFTAPEQTTEFSVVDHHTQAWAHELFHQIGEGPGFCVCSQGCTGFNYSVPGECTWISHSSANCQSTFGRINGTMVPHYWSDVDGRCICPGTGSAWTRPPVQTGSIIRRYIFQKLDDLDNGATAAIGSSGTVFFNVKKAGIEYKVKSVAGAVLVNQWADIWFTFDSTANQARIYINNVLYNTASTEPLLWNNTHSHTILGNYNMGGTIGQFRGRMDDFRLYRSAVVNSTDVDNLNGNGLTVTGIENTPEQGVFIVNRVKIDKKLDNTSMYVPADVASGDVPAPIASFTTTSFTSSSFTI